jgi:EAL domain-containing protein (putative c-di-GMP-specific phosphodiesterase class I)
MDVVYQRILSNFMRHYQATNCRIVLDDYGVGEKLRRYLRFLENAALMSRLSIKLMSIT